MAMPRHRTRLRSSRACRSSRLGSRCRASPVSLCSHGPLSWLPPPLDAGPLANYPSMASCRVLGFQNNSLTGDDAAQAHSATADLYQKADGKYQWFVQAVLHHADAWCGVHERPGHRKELLRPVRLPSETASRKTTRLKSALFPR